MQVFGFGVGRTGTYSLKLAINRLQLGPCHHMEMVLQNMSEQVPLWSAAIDGQPDWDALYGGFNSAVDWPTAAFSHELIGAYPSAKFILTQRSPERWAESYSSTIQKLVAERDQAPQEMREWLEMANRVITRTGFPATLDRAGLIEAFVAHTETVKSVIPADQLLIYEVKEGWEPLCDFLQVSAPDEPFPRTNRREEFWELVRGAR